MINNMLLSTLMVITLLLPVNIQSHLAENVENSQENNATSESNDLTDFTEIAKDIFLDLQNDAPQFDENAVQPATTVAAESNEATDNQEKEIEKAIEDQKVRIEQWKNDFPVYEKDTDQVQFIQAIAPSAVLIAEKYGIYPSVMIAQAALESQWGQSELAQEYNNLMGTKGSWQGESVNFRTREDVNGQSVYINAGFSVYDSWASSLYRYGQLMGNGLERDPEFYKGTWRANTTSYQDATAWLQGRYASDSTYSSKLNRTIQSFELDQYDTIESPGDDFEEVLSKLQEAQEINL